jgi:hypothetical protein
VFEEMSQTTIDGLYYSFGADFDRQYLQILLHGLTEKNLFSGKIVLGRRFGSSKARSFLIINRRVGGVEFPCLCFGFLISIVDYNLWPTKYVKLKWYIWILAVT